MTVFKKIIVLIFVFVVLLPVSFYAYFYIECYCVENSSKFQSRLKIIKQTAIQGELFDAVCGQLSQHGITCAPVRRQNPTLNYSASYSNLYPNGTVFSHNISYITGANIPTPFTSVIYYIYDDGIIKSVSFPEMKTTGLGAIGWMVAVMLLVLILIVTYRGGRRSKCYGFN